MKVCITSQGSSLDSQVDERFGRAKYFIIYDTESKKSTPIENNNISGDSGVGIQSAQLMVDNEIKLVVTGHVGPKASAALNAANIEIKTNASGSIKDVIAKLG